MVFSTDTYGVHHWYIWCSPLIHMVFTTEGFFEVALESWVRLEPTTTEFLSDALTDWAIRPWLQHALTANLYSYSNFIVCSVSDFISAIAFVSCHVLFSRNFVDIITWNELIYIVFTTEEFFEVAIETCHEFNWHKISFLVLLTICPDNLFHDINLSFLKVMLKALFMDFYRASYSLIFYNFNQKWLPIPHS